MSSRIAILAALAAVSACDPCTGVVGCTVGEHVAASGRILDEATGVAAAGIAVDFVRTAGVALERDSVRMITDSDGQFEFDVAARDAGRVDGYFRIHPADRDEYRVFDVSLRTSTRRGEAQTFGPWSTAPHAGDLAEIRVRGAPTFIATNTRIEFRRTGGVDFEGLGTGTFTRTTSERGWMPLFGNELRPLDAGDVIGDLTVFAAPPIGTITQRNVHIPITAMFRPGLGIRSIGVGPSMEYHIALIRRGRNVAVSGAEVQFHWTSGIDVQPRDWSGLTDIAGRVAFPVRARTAGVMVGDLRVVPPAPWKSFERRGMVFETFDADTARLYATLEVGPGVSGYAVFRANGLPVKGVKVEARRTAGLPTPNGIPATVSNDTGYTYITSATDTEGDITADLTVTPPAPYRRFTIRGVRLQARDGDAPTPPYIIGQWDVAAPPASLQSRP